MSPVRSNNSYYLLYFYHQHLMAIVMVVMTSIFSGAVRLFINVL